MNVPQNIGETIWFNHVRTTMPEYIRVIGRVVGEVYIKDIDKKVCYNRVLDISVIDANGSNDLINAIAKGWIDVIHGKHFLVKIQRHEYTTEINRDEAIVQSQPTQQIVQQQVDLTEIKNYVNNLMQTSTTAIIEQLKQLQPNGGTVVDKSVIDNIVGQITSKLSTVSNDKSAIKDVADSVFINLDQSKELKTNINGEIGTVTTQEDKKSKSVVKKLKTIK